MLPKVCLCVTAAASKRTLGSATLASQRLPSMVWSICSAADAHAGSTKVTKPKPLLLPLTRSFMTSVASTTPY